MSDITFESMNAKWNSTEERLRRLHVAELLQMYRGDWTLQLDAEIKKLFMPQNYEKLRLRADTSFNILKWAVDTLGAIYSKPVTRELNSDQAAWDSFRDLDLALDQCSRLLYICRELFIRPIVYEDGTVLLDILTPDNVVVIPSETNPWGMKALLYSIDNGKKFILWTSESHYILGPDFVPLHQENNPDNENPYGMIPWLCLHARYPASGSFFNDLDSEGLRQANLATALAKTDFNHLRHIQSFKQLVFTGMSDESTVRAMMDPATALSIKNPNAGVQVLDMQADLKAALETIIASGASSLNLLGLKPDLIKGNMSAQSGYALSIMMHDTERVWDQQRQLWKVYEEMLYQLTSHIMEVDIGMKLPEGQINITYGNLSPSSNPTEQASYFTTLVQNGLMSKKQAMIQLFDYTQEEVDNEFEQMEAEVRLSSAMSPFVSASQDVVLDDEQAGIEVPLASSEEQENGYVS